MRPKLIAAAIIAASLLSPMALRAPFAQSTSTARVIVKYKADSGLMHTQALTAAGARISQMRTLGQRVGATLTAGSDISESSHVVFAKGMTSEQLAATLAADSEVEYAVPDRKLHRLAAPNDPLYTSVPVTGSTGGPLVGQWYLKPPGPTGTAAKTAPSAINAEAAWDITTGNANIVVAVLDTGIRFDHPDFKLASAGGNVYPGYDMIAADPDGSFSTAGDGNGRDADASDPGDGITAAQKAANSNFSNCTIDSTGIEASSWHGTQTLSFIGAATNNGIGMASVGRNVSVMPVRVLGKCGEGFTSDIIAGMLWAAGVSTPAGVPANTHPARVINLSLGGDGPCDAPSQAAITQLNAAGVVVVASAGNSGIAVGSPANCTGAIAVAGLRQDGDKLGVSSLGSAVAISAPGSNCPVSASPDCGYPMLAAYNSGQITPLANTYTDAFTVFTGTSFSAPLVAGAAALMLSVNPSLTPAQVRAKLMSSARAFPTTGSTAPQPPTEVACLDPVANPAVQIYCYCTKATCGAGMLDVRAAVAAATSIVAAISVTTPTPTAGAPVTLTSTSTASGGTISTDAWTITSAGSTGAAISGAANASTVTVQPTAAGTFTIGLTVTDSFGNTSTTSSSVVVAAVVVTTPPATGSSGGGGALGIGWLVLLLTAMLSLVAIDRVERRRVRAAAQRPGALAAQALKV